MRLRGAKIWSKSLILMFFESWEGFWNMPSCFQMFVHAFKTFMGVKNDPEQKMSFFSTNPLLKTAISWFDFCRYKPLTFWWFQCIFLTNWLSRMGKPLVPVGPTHFSHLGHPIVPVAPWLCLFYRLPKNVANNIKFFPLTFLSLSTGWKADRCWGEASKKWPL